MVLNYRAVLFTLGILVFFLGIALLLPMLVALLYGEPEWWTFGVTALGSLIIGTVAWIQRSRSQTELQIRDGFAIVAMAWVVLSLIGALPFVMGGVLESYTDAFFETMSAFTTTGSTIFGGAGNPDIEDVPHAFLFWRSLAHWIGGMGIIVLTLAILPLLGVGGMQLYKAEVPGPSADKLTPRVQETAKRLWMIYVGITFVEFLVLLPAMNTFDAINHAFATMATGGFSTKNGSVGQFGSAYIDWVITIFMFLAGVNFALHFRMLRGKAITVFRDTEFRVYVGITLVATLLITIGTWAPAMGYLPSYETEGGFLGYATFMESLRYGAFQASAIITTTGFGTADYEIWPPLAVGIIFICFYIGGMAGSTGGGVKVIRHVLMFKNSFKEIKQLIHPQAIMPVRLGNKVVSQEVMKNVLSFIVLYLGLIGFGTMAMSFLGLDILTSFGATLSSVGNVGPAFGTLGPTENYAHLPQMAKWVLSFLMMAGRLEIFTVIIVFVPAFWKR
ncbi:MAG: TrkH family potassium uptake protein [Bacteroidetes Order II. Incertae sedis bacterium]|jgi:trk system potassium uptake protein TrkH|nr:TrkH family potassium uptake protein [Bacteroidetes Order II. bacterium]MBT6425707.1 TrkH family potassium uptake protein [Bacteroidetes Order II. bacterium]MBT6582476.1 TrkH family potassium uptake protein [Bacteroidetes Order II. bacterium]MBT7401273.1 TrkH family potassium uptake protein [Bacteroidetes Order II. bacterium]